MKLPFFNSTPQATDRGYVHSYTFSGISDPFEPRAIWERPRSMRRDQERLKGLLDRHAYRVGGAKHVLNHLIVELPLADIEDDHRICGGESSRNLERELTEQHRQAYGGDGAAPRYRVEGALDLADDEVRVRFGHGIYLPDPGDRMAWKIESSIDGVNWNLVFDMPEQQRVAIVGQDRERTSFICRDWPFTEDLVLIVDNLPGAAQLAIAAKPREALTITESADLGCQVIQASAGGRLYLRTRRLIPLATPKPAEPPEPLKLVAAPRQKAPVADTGSRREPGFGSAVVNAPSRMEPTAGALPEPANTSDPDLAGTMLPASRPPQPETTDETWVCGIPPTNRASLQLVGLAIQRLSRFANHGIRALRFGLDAQGRVMPADNRHCALRFEIRPDDTLLVAARSGQRPLTPGEKLPLPAGGLVQLRDLPAALGDHYLGWMPLSAGPVAVLPADKEIEAGRDRRLKELSALQALSGRGFLDADHDPGADCMGISSRHAKLQLTTDGLQVTALGRMPLAVLDAEQTLAGALTVGETRLLRKDEYLIFGHYVWQFRQ